MRDSGNGGKKKKEKKKSIVSDLLMMGFSMAVKSIASPSLCFKSTHAILITHDH